MHCTEGIIPVWLKKYATIVCTVQKECLKSLMHMHTIGSSEWMPVLILFLLQFCLCWEIQTIQAVAWCLRGMHEMKLKKSNKCNCTQLTNYFGFLNKLYIALFPRRPINILLQFTRRETQIKRKIKCTAYPGVPLQKFSAMTIVLHIAVCLSICL